MPMMKMEWRRGTYTPAALGNETVNLGRQLTARERIVGFRCKVVKAADGTNATVSFGRTGATGDFMQNADVATRVAGLKKASTGAGGAGFGSSPGAVQMQAQFVVGDATVIPVIQYAALVVQDSHYDKMFGLNP